jgi:predicted O-methyltransferase YrrM
MLTRIADFFSFLDLPAAPAVRGRDAAETAAGRSAGMTHRRDYEALAAIALRFQPRRIFEIGTYKGVTSDFFLSLLPECEVVSIAYQNPAWRILGPVSNNSELTRSEIGSEVQACHRPRFTQLLGDSHKLDARAMLRRHGAFDLVFVDGDHTGPGVAQDTALAQAVLGAGGSVCWHDANPKPAYREVRTFLEEKLPLRAIATADDYIGGVACWNPFVEERLARAQPAIVHPPARSGRG